MDAYTETEKITEIKNNWDYIVSKIRDQYHITDIAYNTWLALLSPYSFSEGYCVIAISSENIFFVKYITDQYKEIFQVAIGELLGEMVSVAFKLQSDLDKEDSQTEKPSLSFNNNKNIEAYEQAGLNPKYTFENFVVGGNNNLAHASSVAVAENPGRSYNPLFLYSGAGLGKTHLMHSIGHYIIDHSPDKKVLYVTSEVFTNEVITSIRSGSDTIINQFREKYRNVDVLMIDDIQFIIGKESTQEEFFHTFNTLHAAGKQIVLTSDKPPKEMTTLEDRLKSRFEWGLQADIQIPDYETRMAILEKKAELAHVNMSHEICDYVASNIKSNIRELEGAFNKIIFFSRLNKAEITLEMSREALKDIIAPREALNMEAILNAVCGHYGVSPDAVLSSKRTRDLVTARQVFAYLCKDLTQTSVSSIARKLGKDHTTIMHSIEKVENLLKEDKETIKNISALKKSLTDE